MKSATLRRTCRSVFDPRDYGDVGVWYDTSDVRSMTLRQSGSQFFVSELRNKAGLSSGDMFSATAAYQPELVVGDGGSAPFIRTSDTTPNYFGSVFFQNSLFGTTDCTIFVAARPRTGNSSVRFLYNPSTGSSERVLIFWPFNQTQSTFYHRSPLSNSSTTNWTVEAKKYLLAYHRRGSRIATFRDGALLLSANTATGSLAATNVSMTLFNNQISMATQYRGDFYEMVVIRSSLSDEAIDVITRRMMDKWGV